MKPFTVLDIETAPTARGLARDYPISERQHPANYKNQEAIDNWYKRDEEQWRAGLAKECALTARLGRIVAVGFWTQNAGPIVAVELDEQRERDLILCAITALQQDVTLVTFNGMDFDVPFLETRALVHGLTLGYTPQRYSRRYSFDPHCDLFRRLCGWHSGAAGTLGEWCEALNIPHDNRMTGADIGAAVARGDDAFVHAHCTDDVRATAALYERLCAAGLT